jgi:hypothetical protein
MLRLALPLRYPRNTRPRASEAQRGGTPKRPKKLGLKGGFAKKIKVRLKA